MSDKKSENGFLLYLHATHTAIGRVNAIYLRQLKTYPSDRQQHCSCKDLAVEDKEDQTHKHNNNARRDQFVRRHASIYHIHPRKPLTTPQMAYHLRLVPCWLLL